MSKQIPPQVVKNINELLTDEPRRPTQIMKAYSKKFSKGLNTKAIGFLNIEAMLRATPGVEMVMLDGEENYVNARDYRESLKNRNQTRTNSAAAKKPTSKKEKDARKAKPSSQLKISNSSFWSGNFATDLNKSVWTAEKSPIYDIFPPKTETNKNAEKPEFFIRQKRPNFFSSDSKKSAENNLNKPFAGAILQKHLSAPKPPDPERHFAKPLSADPISHQNFAKMQKPPEAELLKETKAFLQKAGVFYAEMERLTNDAALFDDAVARAVAAVLREIESEKAAQQQRVAALRLTVRAAAASAQQLLRQPLGLCPNDVCFELVSAVVVPCGHLYCSSCARKASRKCFLCGKAVSFVTELEFS